mgnify:CR=1 FL=1
MLLVFLNVPMIGVWVRMLQVPYRFLFPAALFFIAVGNFSTHNSLFEVLETGVLGVLAAVLLMLDFPLSPVLLGFILGGLMEQNLRRALSISNGALEILWSSPITFGVWVLTAIMLLMPLLRIWRKRSAAQRAVADV